METAILIGAFLGFAVVNGVLLWYFLVHKKNGGEEEKGSMMLLQQQLQELTKTMDAKLSDSSKQMHESMKTQMKESNRIIKEVTRGLTKLDDTNKQVISFADQLQNLQDILKNPKQRGVLGEYYLETVLKNVLPTGSYQMQYAFKDGDIVDAVVMVQKKVVPVDSKFSLENYNRMVEARDKTEKERLHKIFLNDLKERIKETAKYIKPTESTTDFAFMFIPSEGIYYDLLVNRVGSGEESLIQVAASKYKVIIVSPTSFLAYLQTVLQGLKALQIEEKAEDIIKNVEKLPNDDVLKVIKRSVKQRQDSIEQFTKGGRPELAKREQEELEILKTYLPEAMSKDKIEEIASRKKEELGIDDKAKMGMLMGAVMKETKGEADGNDVKEVIESLF